MSAVFKREFKSYFTSPLGWIVMFFFLISAGVSFAMVFASGSKNTSSIFVTLFAFSLVLIPILTMRTFSEDKRLKTDQITYTAPVKLTSVVMGKFFAAFMVYLISISITVVFQIIIAFFITPDWTVFLGCLLAVILSGSALVAIGMFISSLTESMLISAVLSLAASVILVAPSLLSMIIQLVAQSASSTFIAQVVEWVSFLSRFTAFASGQLEYSNIVFFISFTVVFLFLSVRMLDRKRWA